MDLGMDSSPRKEIQFFPTSERKGFWERRTHFQKSVLGVISTVVATILFCIVVTFIHLKDVVKLLQEDYYARTVQVCNTEVCRDAGMTFKNVMNLSALPCDDFVSFVCGNYVRESEMTEGVTSRSTLDDVTVQVYREIAGLLANPVIENPHSAIETTKAFFQGCLTSASENEREKWKEEVNKILSSVGGMPLLPRTHYSSSLKWQRRLATVQRQLHLPVILQMNVVPDAFDNPSANLIGLTNALPDIFENEEKQTPSKRANKLKLYKEEMKRALCWLREGSCANTEMRQQIDEIADFEFQLAKFQSVSSNKYSLKILDKAIPQMEFSLYLKELLKETKIVLTGKTKIIADNLELFENITTLIEQTNPKTVANYVGWRIIKHLDDNSGLFEALPTVPFRLSKNNTVNSKCVQATINLFPNSVANIHVRSFFNRDALEETRKIVVDLKSAMKSLLLRYKWMDEDTRQNAIKKIRNMKDQVAYPDWILYEPELNQMENPPAMLKKKNFLSSVVKILHFKEMKKLNELSEQKHIEWSVSSVDVDAEYKWRSNQIYVYPGLLRPPFLQMNVPRSLNYGGIGSIIGHEIIHGFDNEGKDFDETGRVRDWWTKTTRSNYQTRVNCFIEQYGNVVDNHTQLHLNGDIGLGENLADNGGLRAAYEAYLKTNPKDERLVGLEKYSHKQLFFISYGTSMCGKYSDEKMRELILNADRTPNMYRILIPSQNMIEFAESFRCPIGSTMNPEERCKLW